MKVQGTYQSVIKGVSQQAPQDRLEGQFAEVVNMVPDPVRGLVRRNGFTLEHTHMTAMEDNPLLTQQMEEAKQDANSFRTLSLRTGGADFDMLYRSRPRFGEASSAHMDAVMLYRKDFDKEGFVETKTRGMELLDAQGYAAAVAVGRYILLAPSEAISTVANHDRVYDPANRHFASIWIRGGGYSRTYSITAVRKSTNTTFTVSYTTPKAQYDGILDFSGITIPPDQPEYQAEVNKIQGAYDTAVNQHTAMAAAAIVPAAIARELAQRFATEGWTGWTVQESTLLNPDVAYLECTDGTNGEYIRDVLNQVAAPDELPAIAQYGKVVKVSPKNADPYYMEAQAANPEDGVYWGKVVWREAAGIRQTPTVALAIGTVYDGKLYLGADSATLQSLLTDEGITLDVPVFEPSTAGDPGSVKPPNFFKERITMLKVFQDRLCIGAGGGVSMSKIGEYFTFFKTTVLSELDNDPLEVFATGSADDTIRHATAHEMNLFVHGDKRHYMINGRQPITPTNAFMGVMWAVDNSAAAQPVSNGANLFITKEELQVGATRLLQVQPGMYQDIPQLNDVSQQLRDYVNGFPAESVAFLNPGCVFIRTEPILRSKYGFPRARRNGIYMYMYLDVGEQRPQEAWGSWEWSEFLGQPVGIASAGFGDTLRIYTLTYGEDMFGLKNRGVLAMRASIRPDPTGMPCLDGMQLADPAQTGGLFTPNMSAASKAQLFTSPGAEFSYEVPPDGHDPDVVIPDGPLWSVGDGDPTLVDSRRWKGSNGWLADFVIEHGPVTEKQANGIFTGFEYHAYAELTNPFVRNQEGKAQPGLLKLTRMTVTTTRTVGMRATWKDFDGKTEVLNFGGEYSQIDYKNSVFIGRDTRYVQVRLQSVKWYPLTINSIAWTGNWFGQTGGA